LSISLAALLVASTAMATLPYPAPTDCAPGTTQVVKKLTVKDEGKDVQVTRVMCADDTTGNIDGEVREYYMTGNLRAEGAFVDGEQQGPVKIYYDTPKRDLKMTGMLDNDREVGTWTKYNPDGTKQSIRVYDYDKKGQLTGTLDYATGLNTVYQYSKKDPTKQIGMVQGKVVNGMMVGEWTHYDQKGRVDGKKYFDAKGNLVASRSFSKKNGDHGTAAFYYADGTVKGLAPVKKGRFNGWGVLLAKDGSVIRRVFWENGKEVDGTSYVEGTCKNYDPVTFKVDMAGCKLRDGHWDFTTEDGQKCSGDYQKGKKLGLFSCTKENGQVCEQRWGEFMGLEWAIDSEPKCGPVPPHATASPAYASIDDDGRHKQIGAPDDGTKYRLDDDGSKVFDDGKKTEMRAI
jgi:antitoxin component YwqK of YwqJK toxin-antitoxin module